MFGTSCIAYWHQSHCIQDFLTRPRGYKTFFMLNSTDHEIYHAHKCLAPVVLHIGTSRTAFKIFLPDLEVVKLFSCSTQLSMKFIMLINVKMPTES